MVEKILKIKVNGKVVYIKDGYEEEIKELIKGHNIESLSRKEILQCKEVLEKKVTNGTIR